MPHFIIPYLMKKIISILSVITLLSACKEKKSFTLSGHVDGLKKGTLYLQKMKDTLIVNLDSIQIKPIPISPGLSNIIPKSIFIPIVATKM